MCIFLPETCVTSSNNNNVTGPVYVYLSTRYLCDFIYFTSLSVSKTRTAFIHVPPLDRPYSAHQLAVGLRLAIRAMIKQMTQQQQPRLASY